MTNFEKYLYQENTISQQLFMLFIIGNTSFLIFFTNNVDVDYDLGLFILLNIVLSLVSFLIAVRQKLYLFKWGIAGIIIAGFQFLRLLWIPEEIVNPLRLWLQVTLILTSVFAMTGSIICLKRTRDREKYLMENDVNMALLQK